MILLFVIYTCHGKLFLFTSKPPIILKLPSIGVTWGTPQLEVLAYVDFGTPVEVKALLVSGILVDVSVEAIVEKAVVKMVGALVLGVVVDNVGNNVDNSPVVVTGAAVLVIHFEQFIKITANKHMLLAIIL